MPPKGIRNPKRDKAFELWINKPGISLATIAKELGVGYSTLRNWKIEDDWDSLKLYGKQAKEPGWRRPVTPEDEQLNEKQRMFCLHYVKLFNATQAAIKAGYAPTAAHVTGPVLLKYPHVKEEIRRLKEELCHELHLDIRDVISKYAKIAFADVSEYVRFGQKDVQVMSMLGPVTDAEGNPVMKTVNFVDFLQNEEVDGSIISEIRQGKDGVSVKLHDKIKALEKLEKYLDYMTEEDKLKFKKVKAETRLIEEKTKLIKGSTKDTSLLEGLIKTIGESGDDDDA